MLSRLVVSGAPIIYLDETTFHYHMRQSKVWQRQGTSVKLPLNNRRFSGVTLFGAISNCFDGAVMMVGDATNTAEFCRFLEMLIDKVPANVRPHLVIDNHIAHRSKKATDIMSEHFELLWLPVNSCQFNSIERLWADIKRRFRQHICQLVGRVKCQQDLVEAVQMVAWRTPDSIVRQLLTSNRQYMLKYLIMIQRGTTEPLC